MARGWESKSVEDQIQERAEEQKPSAKRKPSKAELERRSRRDGLRLARARTASTLLSAQDVRYRVQLEKALVHLDAEIAELEK